MQQIPNPAAQLIEALPPTDNDWLTQYKKISHF